MGRLSNPPETINTLISRELITSGKRRITSRKVVKQASCDELVVSTKEEGQLSNPVQRRLLDSAIDHLVEEYVGGLTIDALACRYEIHRTTVMTHLEARGVQRRRSIRKLSAADVAEAANHYQGGLSLAALAKALDVNEATLTREFHAAGISIRPRRGWT
jgi:AraC-like DNA-binding protein